MCEPMPRLAGLPLFLKLGFAFLVSLAFGASSASAGFVDLGASSASGTNSGTGNTISASVDFQFDSLTNTLEVVLTNTATVTYNASNKLQPSDILGAVFFSLPNSVTLTPGTANLTAGSSLLNAGTNAADGWGYASGLSAPGGANQGISAAGFGLFGSSNFSNSNGQNLDGFDYELVDKNYAAGTGNSSNLRTSPLIEDSMTFLFTASGPITASDITKVSFQYGTGLSEPNVQGPNPNPNNDIVPVPASFVMFGMGGLGMGLSLIRSRRRLVAAV